MLILGDAIMTRLNPAVCSAGTECGLVKYVEYFYCISVFMNNTWYFSVIFMGALDIIQVINCYFSIFIKKYIMHLTLCSALFLWTITKPIKMLLKALSFKVFTIYSVSQMERQTERSSTRR